MTSQKPTPNLLPTGLLLTPAMKYAARLLIAYSFVQGLNPHAEAAEPGLGARDFVASRANPVSLRGDDQGGFYAATPPHSWFDGTRMRLAQTTVKVGAKGQRSKQITRPEFSFDANADTRNLRWRSPLPNWSNSSPIVVDDKVVLMCEPLEAFPLLLCFDAESGRKLWSQEISPLENEDPQTRIRVRKQWSALIAKARELSVLMYQRKRFHHKLSNNPDDAEAQDLLAKWEQRAKPFAFKNFAYQKPGLAGDGFTWTSSSITKVWNNSIKQELAAYGCSFIPWDTALNGKGGQAWMGYSHTSPVSDGHWIWVYTGNNTAACFGLDGKLRWSQRLGPAVFVSWHNYLQSPVLAGDHLLCSSKQELVCLHADTGKVLWRQSCHATRKREDSKRGNARVGPLSPGRKIQLDKAWYFFWDDGRVYRITDGKRSERILEQDTIFYSGFPPLQQGNRLIFAASSPKGTSVRCVAFSVVGDSVQHEELWRSERVGKDKWGGGHRTSGPMEGIWYKDRLYIGPAGETHGGGSFIHQLDPTTGKVLAARIELAAPQSRMAGPVGFRDGFMTIHCGKNDYATISMVGYDGKLLARNYMACAPYPPEQREAMIGNNGRPQWSVGSVGAWHSSPFLVGDRIYLRSRQHLYCIGPQP